MCLEVRSMALHSSVESRMGLAWWPRACCTCRALNSSVACALQPSGP